MKRTLLFCFSIFLLLAQAEARPKQTSRNTKNDPAAETKPTPPEMPPPAILVSFGRLSLRESDREQVELWLSNNSDQSLQNVTVEIATPKFVHWHQNSCDAQEFGRSLNVGEIKPRSTVTHKLCLTTDSEINVGDFNALFTVKYEWDAGGARRQSFVSSEKTLKVNLLGSESVAGVPLALAGLIVPGMFFWIFLRLWGVPLDKDFGKELIYSVLVSLALIASSYLLRLLFDSDWLKYFDISSGIGLNKLLTLAATGFVLGNFFGFLYYRWQRYKKSLLIAPTDIFIKRVEKIVRQNPGRLRPKTTVTLKTGGTFVGSLHATNNGITWLVGWFSINLAAHANDADFIKKMRGYAEKNDYLNMLRLARQKNIELTTTDTIKEIAAGGAQTPRGMGQNWGADQVSGTPQGVEDPEGRKLLVVAGI
jgi:hypothetical protein